MPQDLVNASLDFLARHTQELVWLGIASAALCAIGVLLLPYVVYRLPSDFFVVAQLNSRKPREAPSLKGFVLTAGRTALAALLILLGVIMLVTPGQGVLTILMGIALLPIAERQQWVTRALKRSPGLKNALNTLRRRLGKPAFEWD